MIFYNCYQKSQKSSLPEALKRGPREKYNLRSTWAVRHGRPPPLVLAGIAEPQPVATAVAFGACVAKEEPPNHVQRLCAQLQQRDHNKAQVTIRTLHAALANVLSKPTEPKYRRLKSDNKRVQAEVLRHEEAVEILRLCGFVRDGADFVLPDTSPLQPLRDVLGMMPPLSSDKRAISEWR